MAGHPNDEDGIANNAAITVNLEANPDKTGVTNRENVATGDDCLPPDYATVIIETHRQQQGAAESPDVLGMELDSTVNR